MRKFIALLLVLACLMPSAVLVSCAGRDGNGDGTEQTTDNSEEYANMSTTEKIEKMYSDGITTAEQLKALRALVWQEYAEKIAEKYPERAEELQKNKVTNIKIQKTTMKVNTVVVGKQPEDGYSLFLVYHGGGYDPSGQINESQWSGMGKRYTQTGVPGIYVAIRSVSDNESSGQIFSTDVSWQFYDRIIEDAILYLNADPNKVYIVGYSAGGNGVYQIAPTMADRLASATMTAGHPEWIDLSSLYNLPFFLNAAEKDTAYKRNTVTVEYAKKLDDLAAKYGGGYEHYCFIHAGKEHGLIGDNATTKQSVIKDIFAWYDAQTGGGKYSDGTESVTTDAATLMTAYTRNPLPERVVWNLSTSRKNVRDDYFYWLSSTAQSDIVDASYDKQTNTITINKMSKKAVKDLTIYLNEDMVDVFSEVKVVMPGGSVKTYTPEISLDLLRETTSERRDPNLQFCFKITVN